MNAKLTAKETALLTAIAEGKVSFFDMGLVAGSNCWSDVLTDELTGIVSDSARGVARVAGSLCKKGLLESDLLSDEDGASFYITEAGEAWFAENFPKEEAPVEEAAAEVTEEEAHIGRVILEQAAAAEEVAPAAAEVTEHTDTDGAEWILTTFADGSYTLRRRRQVSGAWRTDFWGQAAGTEKRVSTTSKAAKAALEAGRFTI